jgi:hypothetical protein
MFFTETSEVFRESLFQGGWQSDYSVSAALAIMDGDGALAKIEVLDAQAHGLHQPEATAIHDLCDQFPGIFEAGEDGADFLAGHYSGRSSRATGWGDGVEGEFLDAEDVLCQKGHGIERLLLGGRGDVSFQSEKFEVGSDRGRPEDLRGLAELLVAESDERLKCPYLIDFE